jgi:hypothetical protein
MREKKKIIFHIAFTMAANCPARLTFLCFSALVIFCVRCNSDLNCSLHSVIPPVLSTNILAYPRSDLLVSINDQISHS